MKKKYLACGLFIAALLLINIKQGNAADIFYFGGAHGSYIWAGGNKTPKNNTVLMNLGNPAASMASGTFNAHFQLQFNNNNVEMCNPYNIVTLDEYSDSGYTQYTGTTFHFEIPTSTSEYGGGLSGILTATSSGAFSANNFYQLRLSNCFTDPYGESYNKSTGIEDSGSGDVTYSGDGLRASKPPAIYVYNSAPGPSIANLSQLKSNGVSAIASGGATTENTVVLGALLQDPSTDPLILEIEVSGMATTTIFAASSTLVSAGTFTTTTISGLPNGEYNWRARTRNTLTGGVSAWVNFESGIVFDFSVIHSDGTATIFGSQLDYSGEKHTNSGGCSGFTSVYSDQTCGMYLGSSEGNGVYIGIKISTAAGQNIGICMSDSTASKIRIGSGNGGCGNIAQNAVLRDASGNAVDVNNLPMGDYVIDASSTILTTVASRSLAIGAANQGDYVVSKADTTNARMYYCITTTFASAVACGAKEPIVIVPGIMGSKLNRVSDNEEVWPSSVGMLIPGSDSYLNDLKLTSGGNEIVDIKTGDIIRQELVVKNFYNKLIQSLEDNGYQEGVNLFVAPYDWRFGVGSSSAEIATVIQHAISSSTTGKVNIIAHSMGGLVIREYLKQATSTAFLDKLIFAGSPGLGAPKAFKLLEYGDDMGMSSFGFGLNSNKAKEISQNMPGVYQLLPSRRYLDLGNPYVYFGSGLNFDQTKQLLAVGGRNVQMLSDADTFHQQRDGEELNIVTSTKFYNLIGCQNTKTLGGISIYDNDKFGLSFVNGDGTVPLLSANGFGPTDATYYSLASQTGADHLGLVQSTTTLELIKNLIMGVTSSLAGISQNQVDCGAGPGVIMFGSHSPVSLHVYDAQNRHVGVTASSTIELGIPGSSYEAIEDNNFILVPNTGAYRVELVASSSGTFDFDASILNGVTTTEKITYLKIPLQSSSTRATMDFSSSTLASSTLVLDNDGNGTADVTYQPDAVLTGAQSGDFIPPTLTMPSIPSQVTLNSTSTLIFNATDTESGIALIRATLNGVAVTSTQVIAFTHAGTNTFRLEAIDRAGNPRVQEVSFSVVYAFSGFESPIKPDGTGIYKQGRTLPIKFQLTDANNQVVTSSIAQLFAAKIQDGIAGTDEVTLSTSNADTGNYFRIAGNRYEYNLDTSTLSVGTWQLKATLDDTTEHTVVISVKI